MKARVARGFIAMLAVAAALVMPGRAATALNGAEIDPRHLIADDLEAEALAAYQRQSAVRPFRTTDIVIVDYRLPSNALRLYIVDLRTGAVEPHYVAHGRGSDPGHTKMARRFSDVPTTGMSSVGAYRGGERYGSPNHGSALRLIGLEGTNRNAFDRLIVFHTAPYFDPRAGRFGRSCGCFVVPKEDMTRVYDVIADNGFLYAGPVSLNDGTTTAARDCNSACGNCREPLIADAGPAPVVTASVARPPAPPVAKIAAPIPPPIAPVAIAQADRVPLPLAKPAGITAPMAVAAAGPSSDDAIPVPLPKPGLDQLPGTGQPVAIALVVPDTLPGETPVPAPKPAALSLLSTNGRPS